MAGAARSAKPNPFKASLGLRRPPREISSDESFNQSLAGFSQQLAERFANDPRPTDAEPSGDASHRSDLPPRRLDPLDSPGELRGRQLATLQRPVDRYAYLDEPPPRIHPSMLVLAFGFGVAAAAGALYLAALYFSPVNVSSFFSQETVAQAPLSPLREVAPAPAPPPPPAPAPAMAAPEPVAPDPEPAAIKPPLMEAAAAASIEPEPAAPDRSLLKPDEILELQTLLKSFGFDPGPLDSFWGPLTAAAVRRFEEYKGQQQTGSVDREMLRLLRQNQETPASQPRPAKMTEP